MVNGPKIIKVKDCKDYMVNQPKIVNGPKFIGKRT